MDGIELLKLALEGGAGLIALYLLAGVKGELGHLRGILETLANRRVTHDRS